MKEGDYSSLFARRMTGAKVSIIREIMKSASDPNIISLAGGMPSPDAFPLDLVDRLHSLAIQKYGPQILQYGVTEGFMPLRQALAEHLKQRGLELEPKDVCISVGAQGAINALSEVMLDPGDIVAVESPTFLGSLKSFRSFEAKPIGIKSDEQGILPEVLEQMLSDENKKPKFVYLIPNFQNPSGVTLSLDRRKQIAEIVQEHNAIILEDDPYYDLRYEGDNLPTLKSLAPDNVVYVGSMSKVLSPGMRVGYYVAPGPVAQAMTSVRQGITVHASQESQAVAAEYILGGHINEHIKKIVTLYKSKRDKMVSLLQKHFPNSFHWNVPQGGMFIWVVGPENFNADSILDKAKEQGVLFVPGHYFFADTSQGMNTMRLNFTNPSLEELEKAIPLLASVLS